MGLIKLVLFCVVTFFILCLRIISLGNLLMRGYCTLATLCVRRHCDPLCVLLRLCWVYRYVCVAALLFLCVRQYLECSVRSSPRWLSYVCCK